MPCWLYAWRYADSKHGRERIKEFVALPPLEGPDGVRLSVHEPCNYLLYPNVFVITKDCEYPEAVFKWADYMYDEEGLNAVPSW